MHGFAVSVFTMESTYLLNFGMTLLLLIVYNCVIHCLFADLQRLISKLDKRIEKKTAATLGRFKCLPRVSREPAESNPPQKLLDSESHSLSRDINYTCSQTAISQEVKYPVFSVRVV